MIQRTRTPNRTRRLRTVCMVLVLTALGLAPSEIGPDIFDEGSQLLASAPALAAQPEAPEDHPWQPNQSLYPYLTTCTDQTSPDTAVDAAQVLYAVWADSRNGGSDVYFAYRPPAGAWSANVRVNDAPGTASEPAIAVDAAGNAYAAWTDSRNGDPDIYFAYRPAGGTWAANLRVNGDPVAAQQRRASDRSGCCRHRLHRLDRQSQR